MQNVYPFRHVHLDFHTAPLIEGVAVDFDPDEFGDMLVAADVRSVACFAKCHHGLSYYPTKIGTTHPQLGRDLLGEQLAACRSRGINVTAYTTVVWDELAAESHPEWLQVGSDGSLVGRGPRDVLGWRWLCMNSTYVDYVVDHTRELLELYDVDGIFVDIVQQTRPGCLCGTCLASMHEQGLDTQSDADLVRHSLHVEHRFMERMSETIHDIRPGLPVHHNSRTRLSPDPATGMRSELRWATHLEIEALPTGGWGYDFFPLHVRHIQTLGKPHLGMTGRFHRMWGDFGGLKSKAALEFECFQMLASGSTCAIGDQLHPGGRLDRAVYQRIGEVFRQIAAVEGWCEGAAPVADIGVVLCEEHTGLDPSAEYPVETGALRMLLQLHHQFQFVDHSDDLSRYRLVIVPDRVGVDATLRAKLDAYVEQGGAMLVTGASGVGAGFRRWDTLGIEWHDRRSIAPGYLLLDDDMPGVAEPMAHVIEARGHQVSPLEGAEVLLRIGEPSFERTPTTFTSHGYAPLARRTDDPAVVRNGDVIYCAFPLFSAYRRHGNPVYRKLVGHLIDLLLTEPAVRTEAPTTAQVTVLDQTAGSETRRLVHVLHYPPVRRTDTLDIIEDVLPLSAVPIDVASPPPDRVYLVPSEEELPFTWADGRTTATIPDVPGHQIICIATAAT